MAFYIRKSVSLGPIRFNLSKSGIGTSVGVTGFRVGIRPNGKSYLHAGRHGIYYKEELGGGKNSGNQGQIQEHDNNESIGDYNTIKYDTASSQKLAPQSRKELLKKLNDSYKSFRVDYLCFISFCILAYIAFQSSQLAGISTIVVGIVVTTLVAYWEAKRRTIHIIYDFENDNASSFKKIISAFNFLALNVSSWSLVDSKNISGTHESKLNAGAGNLVNKSDAQIGTGNPPWVETNITVPTLKTRGQTLYMMPDGILVYDYRGIGFVEYDDLSINANTTKFIEERPPSDAKIVDKTWLHPNKNGGPDRRFSNNHEIPICLYGELKIKSPSGMFIYLMTSKHDAPSNFMIEFQEGIRSF